jgi:hypothetical protein
LLDSSTNHADAKSGDRAAREVTVQLGSMRMRVSFDEVSAWEGR